MSEFDFSENIMFSRGLRNYKLRLREIQENKIDTKDFELIGLRSDFLERFDQNISYIRLDKFLSDESKKKIKNIYQFGIDSIDLTMLLEDKTVLSFKIIFSDKFDSSYVIDKRFTLIIRLFDERTIHLREYRYEQEISSFRFVDCIRLIRLIDIFSKTKLII